MFPLKSATPMGNVSETRKILLDCKCTTFYNFKKRQKVAMRKGQFLKCLTMQGNKSPLGIRTRNIEVSSLIPYPLGYEVRQIYFL